MPTSAVSSELHARLAEVRDRLAAASARAGRTTPVQLIAVTKTHPVATVEAVAAAGIGDVGENKVQEAVDKMAQCTSPLRWHLIGHLQRNKARQAVRFAMVHSVDSDRLAVALDAEARAQGLVLDVLVQVNASGESSKGGFAPTEIDAVAERLHGCAGLRVRGAMTMAPYTDDEHTLRSTFATTRRCGERLAVAGHAATELSMGMSNDYEYAVEEGATMVRLGSVLFGERN
jgi:pyridoxal phosphate enzyme (YggS family)